MYEIYKPFRNYLRKQNPRSGLLAVYHYIQFLQFEIPLPKELRHAELGLRQPYAMGLNEWELQTLAREILLNCVDHGGSPLFSWQGIAKANNFIKRIENQAWGEHSKEGDIRYELPRIANRQFHWQAGINRPTISRYYRIANHHLVAPLILESYGMTPRELFQLGVSIAGHFLGSEQLLTPIRNQMNQVSDETCAAFLTKFSRTLPAHRTLAMASQSYDINWAYNFSSLEEFPLVQINDRELLCPLPPLLLRRLSEGLYFDLIRQGNAFNNTLGVAYEEYVRDVAVAANRRKTFQILRSEKYGLKTARKDSIDLLVSDNSATIFVECKASRVRLQAKTNLLDRVSVENELKKMAGFVAQAYKTMIDALGGQYEYWKPNGKPVFPIIVTLDNWQHFGFLINDAISEHVSQAFDEKNLDKSLLKSHPYTIASIDEFEQAIQVMSEVGIDTFMSKKTTGEVAHWETNTCITNFFEAEAQKHVRLLFDWDFS